MDELANASTDGGVAKSLVSSLPVSLNDAIVRMTLATICGSDLHLSCRRHSLIDWADERLESRRRRRRDHAKRADSARPSASSTSARRAAAPVQSLPRNARASADAVAISMAALAGLPAPRRRRRCTRRLRTGSGACRCVAGGGGLCRRNRQNRDLTASLLLMPWTTYDSSTTTAPLRHRPSAGTSPVSQQGGLPRLESGAPKSTCHVSELA